MERWRAPAEDPTPLLEVKLLLNEFHQELEFDPVLEDVQVLFGFIGLRFYVFLKEEFDDTLASFLETVSSVERLSSKDHLIELLPDIDIEPKDVADVLHLSDHEQSVEDLKQFIVDAYNTAEKYKDSFISFK